MSLNDINSLSHNSRKKERDRGNIERIVRMERSEDSRPIIFATFLFFFEF